LEFEHCYRVIAAKDARFDGWFLTGVTSTGVYCRPSCPARTPLRGNVRFFATAAGAQAAGFRACKRCRPEASPGSPEWDVRGDLVGRAMGLIADGVVDREGVGGLARALGFSERHLQRCLVDSLGAGPLELARARRAQMAQVLIERTDLSMAEVALSAGFSSVRQFNTTMREVFASTPTQLRARRRSPGQAREEGLTVRLPLRAPFDARAILTFLAFRAVPGVEEVSEGVYRRALRLPRAGGVVELAPAEDHVCATLWLDDLRDFGVALNRCRRLLDLDADPAAILECLGADGLLGPLVRAAPGRRVPGGVDGFELAARALLGQQVSVAAARTAAARLAAEHGERLARPLGSITHLFPSPAALAAADPASFPLPASRARALVGLARAIHAGELTLDGAAERARVMEALLALPGVGAWTAGYIAMRQLRDPDAFPHGDLGVRRSLAALGRHVNARAMAELSEAWRPYRAYAVMHLWAHESPARRARPARRAARRGPAGLLAGAAA